MEKEDHTKKLIKYTTAEERGQEQIPPVTFVTCAITKTKNKK